MKNAKIFLPALMAATLVGGTVFATDAISGPHHYTDGSGQGMMMGGGYGGCPGMRGAYAAMSPEKQAKYDSIMEDFYNKMQPLRDKLFVKRQELRALQNAANPDVKAVSQAASEINNLRDQMRKERDDLETRLEKEVGLTTYRDGNSVRNDNNDGRPMGGYHMGNGYPMGGYHNGMGPY